MGTLRIALGLLYGFYRVALGVLQGCSGCSRGTLMGTMGILQGYARGTGRARAPCAVERVVDRDQPHLLQCDLATAAIGTLGNRVSGGMGDAACLCGSDVAVGCSGTQRQRL
jgi:hypothetical protein